MTHPDYPSRALTKEWRVAYRRAARRLLVVFALALCCAVVGCWLAIAWASGHVLVGAEHSTPMPHEIESARPQVPDLSA